MNVTVLDRGADTTGISRLGYVDCDVHPFIRTGADFS
jgi:hypothetical protein